MEALSTVAGVLVGAVSTILATTLADRGRWKRDQMVRWDDRRFEVYLRFAQSLKRIHLLSARVTAARRNGARTLSMAQETGMTLLAEAQATRSEA